jgi:hypothetical protein
MNESSSWGMVRNIWLNYYCYDSEISDYNGYTYNSQKTRNAHRILVRIHGKHSLKDLTKKSEDNVTLDLMEMGCEDGWSTACESCLMILNHSKLLSLSLFKSSAFISNSLEVRMLENILVLQEVHVVLPDPILELLTQFKGRTILLLLLL